MILMSEPSREVMNALTGLNPGDDVTITTVRDGEELELELDAHVTEAYHEEPDRDAWGYVEGSVRVNVDLADSAVERLQGREWLRNATHNVDIRAKEPRPGSWDEPSVVMWDPEVEDGIAVRDEWTDLGELRSVEQRE